MRINLRVSGRAAQEIVDLLDGDCVLVGREPSAAAIGLAASQAGRTRLLAVQSANVSANHFLIERQGDRLCVRDLASRNGTWARAVPESELWLTGSEMSLSLGSPLAGSAVDDAPDPAAWTGAEDYASSLGISIDSWLARRDMPARIRILPSRAASEGEPFGRIPLPTGFDILAEPLRTMRDDWLDALARVERYVGAQNAIFSAEESFREDGLVVASPLMRKTIARVVQAAAGGAPSLLLLGPSGAGKEGLARCFHRHSRRAGPFVARNCAMFSRELVRSELFGAERGAFTGSTTRIVGAVERAHAGTLFLDELGELPLELQPTLLRFLDHGEYEPLGAYGQTRHADVTMVGATNRDLRAAALRGEFRLDLWFRLSVHVVEVPPLRERFEDVSAYLQSRALEGGGTLLEAFDDECVALLRNHAWDGNFRELANFAIRALPAAQSGKISVDECERLLAEGAITPPRRTSRSPVTEASDSTDWGAIWTRAAAAFAEDNGHAAPKSWDDVKDYIESYLKPLMFAYLAGSENVTSREAVDLKQVANRVDADRGTASKQIQRYLDRFAR